MAWLKTIILRSLAFKTVSVLYPIASWFNHNAAWLCTFLQCGGGDSAHRVHAWFHNYHTSPTFLAFLSITQILPHTFTLKTIYSGTTIHASIESGRKWQRTWSRHVNLTDKKWLWNADKGKKDSLEGNVFLSQCSMEIGKITRTFHITGYRFWSNTITLLLTQCLIKHSILRCEIVSKSFSQNTVIKL